MSQPDAPTPPVQRSLGRSGFIALALAIACLCHAAYILLTDTFGDASRYSNRSLALPAMGLAVVLVTYGTVRFHSLRLWIRMILWPFATFFCYLAFGAAFLAMRLLLHILV